MNKEELQKWVKDNLFDKRGLLQAEKVKKYFTFDIKENLEYLIPEGQDYKEKIYLLFHESKGCKICGAPTKFLNSNKGYQLYCSKTCFHKDPDVSEKKSKAHFNKSVEEQARVVQSRKDGLLRNHNVNNPSLIPEACAKRQETFDKKWNGNPMRNEDIKNKQANSFQRGQ